ncbi:MAG TPA: MogA/MoaB family molybdenum cofactor biosynthesis protein [Roseiflexaceae bacterium]|nr:MogA/MoaB family molybdenum cofactor biosynthesis protein [Roseiflexaceae bacterium]
MGHREHEARARDVAPAVLCGVITISDTRSEESDTSGQVIQQLLADHGHLTARYRVVKDEPAQIVAAVREFAAAGCQVILTNGGTGIASRDSTFEAIDGLLEKRLPGFGELFRMLSYQEIGAAAMLSRATAGTFGASLVFCMPGSTGAVRLAMQKLIVPQLSHLVWETTRQGRGS